MNYTPLGRRILIKILSKNEVKIAGMTLAVAKGKNHKEWSEQCLWAEVLKLGVDCKDESISVGDVVVIPGAAGSWLDKDIQDGDETHRIIHADDILAVDEEMTEKIKKETVHV